MTSCSRLLSQDKPLTGVEVGVWRGWGARKLLRLFRFKKLYLVDPYDKAPEYLESRELPTASQFQPGAHFTVKMWKQAKKDAKKTLRFWEDKTEFIYERSVDAAKLVPDNIDFVYIDGDHDYDKVKEDIEAWYPKVRKGGMLAGHDYKFKGVGRPDTVKQAVDEFCKKEGYELKETLPDWIIYPVRGNNENT